MSTFPDGPAPDPLTAPLPASSTAADDRCAARFRRTAWRCELAPGHALPHACFRETARPVEWHAPSGPVDDLHTVTITPAGSHLVRHQTRQKTTITIQPRDPGGPDIPAGYGEREVAMAGQIGARAAARCAALGLPPDEISWHVDSSRWTVTAPKADHFLVVDALSEIELGRFGGAAFFYLYQQLSSVRELLELDVCTPACLLALAADPKCSCRCGGEFHGALADTPMAVSV